MSQTANNFGSATAQIAKLNFNALQRRPRLIINSYYDFYYFTQMAANDKYLLYCPAGYFRLVDQEGDETCRISNCANIIDIQWSSYFNQFLILCQYGTIHVFDPLANGTNQLKRMKDFGENMITFTCYGETILVSRDFVGSVIYEYDLSNWSLKRTLKPVVSCQKHELILQMRFSSNGGRLAFVLNERDHPNFLYWIELRQSGDLAVLQVLKLDNVNEFHSLLAVPNDEFLVNSHGKARKLYLIKNSNDEAVETISYDTDKNIQSTALIGGQCLVLQAQNGGSDHAELRFYDL